MCGSKIKSALSSPKNLFTFQVPQHLYIHQTYLIFIPSLNEESNWVTHDMFVKKNYLNSRIFTCRNGKKYIHELFNLLTEFLMLNCQINI